MEKNKNEPTSVPAMEAAAGAPVESKYPRKELIANAQAIFQVPPEVVAGALHGNNADEMTVAEVKQAVNAFLKRKVK